MIKNLLLILLTTTLLLNIAPAALAKNSQIDEFYKYLTDEKIYKEYKDATINVRKKMKITAYKDIEKELGKYSFDVGFLPNSIPKNDVYFFASIIEDNNRIVKKFAIYQLDGELFTSGYSSRTKGTTGLDDDFSSLKSSIVKEELASDKP
ncbi:hypothetical protein ACIQ4I_01780 [Rummeliibacillus sp. NPDC094406]|uniref:hypothetical protein n=1 Tax=Rummeliibacillus sp. NPDC094406 TaxID=3364511 RepID=UPI0038012121